MQGKTTSATEIKLVGNRAVAIGVGAVVLFLSLAAVFLLVNLPDSSAFDSRVEQLFVENADLTGFAELRLLEILAQSGTAFSETLASYRMIIFVLLVFAVALLIASITFLVILLQQNRRIATIERKGIEVSSLVVNRAENTVVLNDFALKLTDAAIETIAVLAEARMDDEFLTGAEIEGVITGRNAVDCDEAAGATRIKRLRDTLGNQMITEMLVKNVARRGYVLAIDKSVIQVI
ncbi:winged helix-turn-helix domain-containing protein [Ketogulonicigenium vulgare]|uniref:Response regulator receiver domain protein (CheY-like protein) n=1 Tax=Ketogulonicigenium vulgare (strain WSH-001) TaxID=759362 RepID=F9Y6L3_KETVW|nr:response regulator transcription factor [Ketogulonicigenium vulgare]AEM42133.1 Response regulator receiver domain protein (CheY-like protein) [Ketogulonicigenium vulgare WSH-001]ALJ79758.1 histidine kinase [Ketogulonicigenium vulgare]